MSDRTADRTAGETIKNHGAFIWSVADLLRGDCKQSEYGRVILPLTVLRRFDCVLSPTRQAVRDAAQRYKGKGENLAPILEKVAGQEFYNTSKFDFASLLDAPDDLADNLAHYIASFSDSARDVIDKFDFATQITKLANANLLYLVVAKFAEVDLHPDTVSNLEMGYLYEELIRRFSELSNETAGEHFTPREVIRAMVSLLFIEDGDALTKPGIAKSLYDGACGTGGMLSVAEEHLRSMYPDAKLHVYGQELNAETYAICRSDMMLKGQSAQNIAFGNTFTEDAHAGEHFDYCIQNPPFGVEWKKVADAVRDEHETLGFAGRFGAGLPRINDGSFLFLQNAIAKMKRPEDGGSRVAIVFNGSPLFTGAAGSGESEIRRWIIENDWLEAVVALPDQLFYNTGISTYFWIVTNRKAPKRRGKVQLIDARECFVKMRKSLGEKRKAVSDEQIGAIVRAYGEFAEVDGGDGEPSVKIFANEAFGAMRITVERPLRVRYEVNAETIKAVEATKAYQKLGEPTRTVFRTALGMAEYDKISCATQEEFESQLGWKIIDAWEGVSDVIIDPMEEPWEPGTGIGFVGALTPISKADGRKLLEAMRVPNPDGEPVTDAKGNVQPDPALRDNENVPLPTVPVHFETDVTGRLASVEYTSAIHDYLQAEVLPYVPDAWVDETKTKIGYEIPLTRHFYTYTPPRPLAEIDAEIKQLEGEIQALLAEVTE